MNRQELLNATQCAICCKPFGHAGLPLFWRVTVERYGVDMAAVRRQDALGSFMGNQALADVMGSERVLASPIGDPKTVTVCETCALEPHPLALLAGDE